MRKRASSFAKPPDPSWYDDDDWPLVVSSFAQQYGIRLYQENIDYPEFCSLMTGLSPDTPLGRIVAIRAEKDPATLKNFTTDQRRIRSAWLAKITARKPMDQQLDEVKAMQAMFKAAFGKKKGVKK